MSPFEELLSLAEAASIWGKEESTIRRAIAQGRLIEGEECRKFGKQWVVTVDGMAKAFCKIEGKSDYAPWSRYKALQNKRQHPDCDCENCRWRGETGGCKHDKNWWEQDNLEGCVLWEEKSTVS